MGTATKGRVFAQKRCHAVYTVQSGSALYASNDPDTQNIADDCRPKWQIILMIQYWTVLYCITIFARPFQCLFVGVMGVDELSRTISHVHCHTCDELDAIR